MAILYLILHIKANKKEHIYIMSKDKMLTSEEIIAFARRNSNSLKDKTNFIRKIFNDEITVEKGVYY